MVRVERSTVIDAPIDTVWKMLRDFNAHDRWHPAVRYSRLENGKASDQIGAVRNFVLAQGAGLREQLLSLSDQDCHLRYTILDGDIPLFNYIAELQLRPVTSSNSTYCVWKSTFETPPGQEQTLAAQVGDQVYQAGFEAVRQALARPAEQAARQALAKPAEQAVGAALTRDKQAVMEGPGIVIRHYGDADVLQLETVQAQAPEKNQIRIQQTAIGLNFIDIHCRTGQFPMISLPGTPGMEAAGTVIDVGAGVDRFSPGQRVAYACAPVGAYASIRTMDSQQVVPLPDDIGDDTAAAILLKGITADFLLHRVHRVAAGETILVYAAAGGVGQLLCQWASHHGVTVIGATSSEQKADVARRAGARHVVTPGQYSLEHQVLALTDGRGADVIYDANGADTFPHSLAALARRGHLVSFGQASGSLGHQDLNILSSRSATLSRPNFAHYIDKPEWLLESVDRLFDAVRRGHLKAPLSQRLPLAEAAAAHRALETGKTTGATIFIP